MLTGSEVFNLKRHHQQHLSGQFLTKKFYRKIYSFEKLSKSNVNNELQSHLANVLTFSKEMGSNGMTAFYWTVIVVLLIIFW